MQIPPDQSRADRSVVSVAIYRVTGGWKRTQQGSRPRGSSSEILHHRHADAVSRAEGSIRQRPVLRGPVGVAGVPSPGHVFKETGQEPKRAPHLLAHQEDASGWVARYMQPRVDRRKHEDGRAVLRPHSTEEGGEPQGSRKGRPRNPLEGRGKQAYVSVERRHSET